MKFVYGFPTNGLASLLERSLEEPRVSEAIIFYSMKNKQKARRVLVAFVPELGQLETTEGMLDRLKELLEDELGWYLVEKPIGAK